MDWNFVGSYRNTNILEKHVSIFRIKVRGNRTFWLYGQVVRNIVTRSMLGQQEMYENQSLGLHYFYHMVIVRKWPFFRPTAGWKLAAPVGGRGIPLFIPSRNRWDASMTCVGRTHPSCSWCQGGDLHYSPYTIFLTFPVHHPTDPGRILTWLCIKWPSSLQYPYVTWPNSHPTSFIPEDGNIGTHLQDKTVSQPRRPHSEHTPL